MQSFITGHDLQAEQKQSAARTASSTAAPSLSTSSGTTAPSAPAALSTKATTSSAGSTATTRTASSSSSSSTAHISGSAANSASSRRERIVGDGGANVNISAGKQVMTEATDLIKGFFGSVQKKVYEVFNEDENEFAEFAGLGHHAHLRGAGFVGTSSSNGGSGSGAHGQGPPHGATTTVGTTRGAGAPGGGVSSAATSQMSLGGRSRGRAVVQEPSADRGTGGLPTSGGAAAAGAPGQNTMRSVGGGVGSSSSSSATLPSTNQIACAGGGSSGAAPQGVTAAVMQNVTAGMIPNLESYFRPAASSSTSQEKKPSAAGATSTRGDGRRATVSAASGASGGTRKASEQMVMDRTLSMWRDALSSVGSNVRDLHCSHRITYDTHRCLIFGTEIEFLCEGELVKSVKVGSRVWSKGQQNWIDAADSEARASSGMTVKDCLQLLVKTQKDYVGDGANGGPGKLEAPATLEEANAITNVRPILRRNRRAWDWPLSRECYRMRFVEVLKSECSALANEKEDLASKLESIQGALGVTPRRSR